MAKVKEEHLAAARAGGAAATVNLDVQESLYEGDADDLDDLDDDED